MLEKNKDYIEMRVSSTNCTFTQNTVKFSIEGYVDSCLCWSLPDPGEPYVIISKEKFEALQTENEQLKKKLEELHKEVTWTCEEWCKANSQNNSWKAAALCDSPKELMAKIDQFSDDIEEWQKATGCGTPDKAREHIADMMDSKKTTIYLGDTHNVIARWQKVTGFNEPKDFIKWKANIEGIMEAWKDRTGCKYPGEAGELLEKWKISTKCETPEAAATWITSYESACERGNELAEGAAEREKEWQDATGCNSPEVAKCRINALINEATALEDNYDHWQEITGFSTPEKCSSYIDTLEEKLEDIKNLIEED